MKKILIINGPNLNLLGNREKDIYGNDSLKEIEEQAKNKCKELGLELFFFRAMLKEKLLILFN